MNRQENIKKMYEQAELDTKNEKDKAVLEKIKEIYLHESKAETKPAELSTWSNIMKNKITKFATAAAIIIAILIINFQFNNYNIVWADVVKQINNHTKYKCRQRIEREQGPDVSSRIVYHLNLQQRRQEHDDGIICIIDMRSDDAVTLELHPDDKKAFLSKLVSFGPRKDPHIVEMVQQYDQESSERLGTKKVNGRTLYGFRYQPNENNDYTVWVYEKTKLPAEIILKHPTTGQTIFMDEFDYDFDLDPSAFSTDIPSGYELETVVADYGQVEPEEVSAQDIADELNQAVYMLKKLPWIKQQIIIRTIDPLGTRMIVYLIGIKADDGNTIVITQGDSFSMERMVWIPDQKLVLETPNAIQLFTHPNGGIYAKEFLESLAQAKSEFFDSQNISEERFTNMIVIPNGKVLGLSANKEMSIERIQELVDSLIEIE